MTDFDAIVVGSGAGGLSAALRLAQQNVSVLVLEAMPAFGGFISPFVRNGYRFDTGVHYLGKLGHGGTFRLLLELLELDDQLDFVELDPDGFDRYVFPYFELRLCKGKQRYHERLQRLFPHESRAISRYFNLIDPGMIPRPTKKKVAGLQPSGGSFYAFIGTRMDPAVAGLTDANIIHFEHTDVNRTFAAVADRQASDPFPYYFITSPSLKDPGHRYAPDSCHTLEIISGLGYDHPFTPWSGTQSRRRGEDYSRLKKQIGMSLVRSAERYIPDLGSNLDFVEFATPLSNEYWVNSVSGGNFGPEQTPAQFGPGRFFDCTAGIEGFFVVGAGAISAGVLSCIASGVWAANQAVEFLEGNIER